MTSLYYYDAFDYDYDYEYINATNITDLYTFDEIVCDFVGIMSHISSNIFFSIIGVIDFCVKVLFLQLVLYEFCVLLHWLVVIIYERIVSKILVAWHIFIIWIFLLAIITYTCITIVKPFENFINVLIN